MAEGTVGSGAVELTSERLLLRMPVESDVDAITQACQDPEIQRWIPVPVPYEREHAVGFVAACAGQWASDTGAMTWAVLDAADRRLVGMVSLHARDPGMKELGFWTAPWARGRGVMIEAATMVCRYAFEVLGMARVEWWAGVGNDASRRLAEKIGFRMEGTCRARLPHRGERLDGWVAGLLPGELR